MRKLPLALACAAILGTTNAYAMGMGELQVRSYLNQPLQAEIPITDVRPADIEALSAHLADEAAFERAGLSRAALAGRIQLRVEGGKRPRIILSSERPLRDPALGVVVRLSGPDGTLVRDYAILLDPPGYQPVAPQHPQSRPTVRAEISAPVAATATSKTGLYGLPLESASRKTVPQQVIKDGIYPVAPGETLYHIAQGARPEGVSVQQAMDAIRRVNPQAFTRHGVLMADAKLRIPEAGELRRLAAEVAATPAQPPEISVQADAQPVGEVPAPSAAKAEPPAQDAAVLSEQAEPEAAPQEPRLAIVQPAPEAAPGRAEPAPVVGEVVSNAPSAGEGGASNAGSDLPLRVVEQIEAMRAENESLGQRMTTLDSQMQKMEEPLSLKDLQIKQLEKLLADAGVNPDAPGGSNKPVEQEEASLLGSLVNPVLLALGGMAALALAFFLGRARRRREGDAALEDARTHELVVPAASAAVAAAMAAPVAASEPAAVTEAMPSAVESLSAPAVDPQREALEEADVMLAYGLHDRALKVLDEAIARMPELPELQARKLRVLHEMGARDAFLHAAETYQNAFPLDDTWWPAIRALGESSYADAPLFGGHAKEPVVEMPVVEPPAAQDVIDEGAMIEPLADLPQVQASPVSIDTPVVQPAEEELMLPMHDLQLPGGTAPWGVVESEPEPLELPPLELDLPDASSIVDQAMADAPAMSATTVETPVAGEVAEARVEEVEPSVRPEPGPGISEDDLMILGIDLSSLQHDEPSSPTPAEAVEGALSVHDQAPASFDEQAAKLDIAQAFIDMSDDDNARILLDEVMREGNDFMRSRAREMLERMGA